MDEAPETRKALPDDLPHAAAADPPLSLERRTPGPPDQVRGKMGLAALGLLILFALVAVFLAFRHFAPHANLDRSDASIAQR